MPSPSLERYAAARREAGPARALRVLRRELEGAPAAQWCECALALAAGGEVESALLLLDGASARFPESSGIASARAACRQRAAAPSHDASMREARALRERGQLRAAAANVERALARDLRDAPALLQCALFQRECQQPLAALDLCERALAGGTRDPSLLACSGQLALALGRFEQARERLTEALRGGADLNRWFLAQGLADAQRYRDPAHADFELFRDLLERSGLTPQARASVLFALGKAHDDVGDFAGAAQRYRAANALAKSATPWSRERWREWIDLQLGWPPVSAVSRRAAPFTPVFIVGMPRSGTTLVAEILARHPEARNRGELSLIPSLRVELSPGPGQDPATVAGARRRFEELLRQDDAPARWYIDKNPLDFRYLGLIESLAPEARVIYCRRSQRDTALSIWKQFFAAADTGYAHDFEAMADVFHDCERMMDHWSRTLKLPTYTLEYEHLVSAPDQAVAELAAFVGMTGADLLHAPAPAGSAIETASRWQARQPIYRSAVGTWRHYAPYVPELEKLFS